MLACNCVSITNLLMGPQVTEVSLWRTATVRSWSWPHCWYTSRLSMPRSATLNPCLIHSALSPSHMGCSDWSVVSTGRWEPVFVDPAVTGAHQWTVQSGVYPGEGRVIWPQLPAELGWTACCTGPADWTYGGAQPQVWGVTQSCLYTQFTLASPWLCLPTGWQRIRKERRWGSRWGWNVVKSSGHQRAAEKYGLKLEGRRFNHAHDGDVALHTPELTLPSCDETWELNGITVFSC